MSLRWYTFGLELYAIVLWIYLFARVRHFYPVKADRLPFRAVVAVVLLTAGVLTGATIAAIQINQPVRSTTWAPLVIMIFTVGTGQFLALGFTVKKKMTEIGHWHPEYTSGRSHGNVKL